MIEKESEAWEEVKKVIPLDPANFYICNALFSMCYAKELISSELYDKMKDRMYKLFCPSGYVSISVIWNSSEYPISPVEVRLKACDILIKICELEEMKIKLL